MQYCMRTCWDNPGMLQAPKPCNPQTAADGALERHRLLHAHALKLASEVTSKRQGRPAIVGGVALLWMVFGGPQGGVWRCWAEMRYSYCFKYRAKEPSLSTALFYVPSEARAFSVWLQLGGTYLKDPTGRQQVLSNIYGREVVFIYVGPKELEQTE